MPRKKENQNTGQKNSSKALRLFVRVTEEEKQKIASLASSANAELSEYIRAAALNRKPKPITSASGERRAIIELLGAFGNIRGNVRQIGDNLNMIARAGNRGRTISETAILHHLQEIEAIGDMLRSLLNHVEK